MKWKTLKGLLGAASVAVLCSVAPLITNAQTTTFPIDFTINFKNYVNVKNGLAGLDANGNITASLLNNARVGGSDSGTDVGAAVANGVQIKDAVNECNQSSPTVFYGADNSNSEIADPANTANLRAGGNVAPSFSIQSINAIVNPNGGGGGENDINGPSGLAGMQAIFAVSGNVGMGGAWYSKNMTPSIPSKYDTFHMRDGKGNIVDEVALLKSVNFQPSIMLLNLTTDASIGNNDGTQAFTTQDVTNASLAEADIKKEFPSVKYVWGYFQASSTHPDFANDPYWANARTIALNTGGLAIDMPSGLQVANTYAYIAPAVSTIKWANANGVKVMILLTPYSLDTDPYDGKVYPQWRSDSLFLTNTKLLISWLAANDALPSAWIVGNYTPIQYWDPNTKTLTTTKDATHTEIVTANTFGSDADDTQPSVAYVTRWVAENAPTNQKNALPAGLFGQTTHVCTTTVSGGFPSTKPIIAASNIGLGSMAYQDVRNVRIPNPTLYGAVVQNGALNMLGAGLNWGLSASGAIYEKWADGQLAFTSSDGTGSLEYYVDLHMDQGHNISFRGSGKNGLAFQSADNSVTTWIYGNSSGGINLGEAITVSPGSTGKATFNNGTVTTGGTKTDRLNVSGTSTLWGTLQFGGAGGTGTGQPTLRARSTDHFLHLYNPYTSDMTQVGLSFDDQSGVTHNSIQLAADGTLQFANNVNFGYGGSFSDPDAGVTRDAKFGNKGIAVSGGIKTDTINVTGTMTTASILPISVTYSALPASPSVGEHIFCSDCYSKLREDSDTGTGILVYWNGTRWNDVLGLIAQH